MDDGKLVELAFEAREHAYTPYSHWAVGAALLCADGTVYQGCNIENAAYTPSNCAERTAFFKAVYDGQRSFDAIAVVGGPEGQDAPEFCAPCGVCRQVMMEFCDPARFRIVLGRTGAEERSYLLRELLPEGFGPDNLK
jgi:cytidine deaminase